MPGLSPLHHIVSLTTTNYSNETFIIFIQNANIKEQIRPLVLTILIALCLSIIVFLTILGNILVLIALCVDFALRSPTHLLMGNLACADLLLGNSIFLFLVVIQYKIRRKTFSIFTKKQQSLEYISTK
jgi:hypothetical protein